jgi:hypothetical protein
MAWRPVPLFHSSPQDRITVGSRGSSFVAQTIAGPAMMTLNNTRIPQRALLPLSNAVLLYGLVAGTAIFQDR